MKYKVHANYKVYNIRVLVFLDIPAVLCDSLVLLYAKLLAVAWVRVHGIGNYSSSGTSTLYLSSKTPIIRPPP